MYRIKDFKNNNLVILPAIWGTKCMRGPRIMFDGQMFYTHLSPLDGKSESVFSNAKVVSFR